MFLAMHLVAFYMLIGALRAVVHRWCPELRHAGLVHDFEASGRLGMEPG